MSNKIPLRIDQSVRIPVDMSPEAISQRLNECAAISELCIALSKAKVIGPVSERRVTNAT